MVQASSPASGSHDYGDEQTLKTGLVVALDASSGDVTWKYDIPRGPRGELKGNSAMRCRVYALPAATVELLRQRRVVAAISCGPQGLAVADETVYVELSDQFCYNDPSNPPVMINGPVHALRDPIAR